MKKYGVLLLGEETTYLLRECDTLQELREAFDQEVKIWGLSKVIPIMSMRVTVAIEEVDSIKF